MSSGNKLRSLDELNMSRRLLCISAFVMGWISFAFELYRGEGGSM
jgi:hypothetical protein